MEDQTVVTVSAGRKGGPLSRVKVYNKELFDTLAEESHKVAKHTIAARTTNPFGMDIMESTSAMRRAKKLTEEREKKHAEELKQRRLQQLQAKQLSIKEANERKVKEQMETREAKREAAFVEKYKDVMEGQVLSKQVKHTVSLLDETAKIKTIKQYEDWNDQVFGHFQRAIENTVQQQDARELMRRRCEAFQQFLDQTNKKPSIFRDIIIESEYDPLELNRKAIKIRSQQPIKDPVRRAIQRTEEEASILADHSAPKPPTSKETLDVKLWAAGKIEDTPHGCFARMMREGRSAESASATKLRASRVVFDHYNYQKGNVAAGAHTGKKVYEHKQDQVALDDKAGPLASKGSGVRVFKDKLGTDQVVLGAPA